MARSEEHQYLDLLKKVLDSGDERNDRTGTGTLSLFGAQMRFSLRDNTFPLLTTKKIYWKGVVEELLWFIQGDTNSNHLKEKGINIWCCNSTRQYLDSIGLTHRQEGDLGPVYGFQWRHFGAKYEDMNSDYSGKGIDQLKKCIDTIRTNPNDRRIIMTAWNPMDLSDMALPPCHMMCQFYVAKGELSCQMYQRSCDMGLGVPFNIASYALLTCLMAKVCDLKPGEFIHTMGDVHIYRNHISALKQQIEREPRPFPKLNINSDKKDIEQFRFDDIELIGYDPFPAIKLDISV